MIVTRYARPLCDVRFVASMLSIPCDHRYGMLPMTPQKHKEETLRTLLDLFEAAAREQPSVMLFEDVHWADPTTLEMLDLLIDRAKTIPVLLVLTQRPELQSRWSQHRHVGTMNLPADPDAERRDNLRACRRQGAAGEAVRADPEQDRRSSAVR